MTDEKGKKGQVPNTKACSNCLAPEGSDSALKLSACTRCGTVVYCSKDCQRAHWKANHKQNCIAKADRVPPKHQCTGGSNDAMRREAAAGEECSICLGSLVGASVTTLQCSHNFHVDCVAKLRTFGVKQSCLCAELHCLRAPKKSSKKLLGASL